MNRTYRSQTICFASFAQKLPSHPPSQPNAKVRRPGYLKVVN